MPRSSRFSSPPGPKTRLSSTCAAPLTGQGREERGLRVALAAHRAQGAEVVGTKAERDDDPALIGSAQLSVEQQAGNAPIAVSERMNLAGGEHRKEPARQAARQSLVEAPGLAQRARNEFGSDKARSPGAVRSPLPLAGGLLRTRLGDHPAEDDLRGFLDLELGALDGVGEVGLEESEGTLGVGRLRARCRHELRERSVKALEERNAGGVKGLPPPPRLRRLAQQPSLATTQQGGDQPIELHLLGLGG